MSSNEDYIIVFQDEVHFQVTTSVTRKWVPKGSKPKVKSAPGRTNVAYSGYMIPSTGELIVTKPSWFNYETVIKSFRDFIKLYPVGEDKKIVLVLDNAPWHKKAVRLIQDESIAEYQDLRDKIIFIFLPPYSPDLNPIEQCWRITRRDITHNTYFPDSKILESTLDNYSKRQNNMNVQCAVCNSFEL